MKARKGSKQKDYLAGVIRPGMVWEASSLHIQTLDLLILIQLYLGA